MINRIMRLSINNKSISCSFIVLKTTFVYKHLKKKKQKIKRRIRVLTNYLVEKQA